MKKSLILFAAAALTLGMASCTDEPIIPEVIGNETPEFTPLVKSASDLAGTSWSYAMEDLAIVDEDGDTLAFLPLSDLSFELTFDGAVAQLAFPDDVKMLTMTENDGDYSLEEVSQMHFAYTYDLPTTSGTLTATDNDITGEPIDMEIPFTYDAASDAIIIVLNVDPYDINAAGIQLVFNRN